MSLRTQGCLFFAIAVFVALFVTPVFAVSLNIRVNASSDDSNQATDGTCSTSAATMDIGREAWCGSRFNSVTIPQGAYITSAYVTFTAKSSDNATTSLNIYGEAVDNSATYTTNSNDISGRTDTTATVAWSNMAAWSTVGATYSTPDISTILQEIVNRPGWTSGNSLSIMYKSPDTSGRRRAEPYDHNTALAPLLHVDYVIITPPVAKRLLLVVVNSGSLTAQESLRKTAFQAWNYTVTTISETASQATFDTNAAANDLAYICETVTASNLSTKLTSKSLGIVNANSGMSTNLAIASTCSTTSTTAVSIDKNQHYITSSWSTGSLTVTSSSQTFLTISGTLASDMCSIGSISSAKALTAIDIGGTLNDNTTAVGRRVQLPWGASTFDFASLNSDGLNLLSRALAWAGGVVGYWKLDESSGTTASDASVNLFAGTLNNCTFAANSVTAKVNTGLTMNGSTAYINRTNSSVMQLTKALSVTAWIKGNSWGTSSYADVILRKGDANPNNYQFAVENGYVALGLDGNDGANAHGNTLLTAGTWYHVVGTWDGTNIKIYVNGTLDNTASTHAAPIGTDTRDLYLGGRSGSTDVFDGVIDDVRFYNHALGSDEIAILKTQGTSQGVHIIKWVEVQ